MTDQGEPGSRRAKSSRCGPRHSRRRKDILPWHLVFPVTARWWNHCHTADTSHAADPSNHQTPRPICAGWRRRATNSAPPSRSSWVTADEGYRDIAAARNGWAAHPVRRGHSAGDRRVDRAGRARGLLESVSAPMPKGRRSDTWPRWAAVTSRDSISQTLPAPRSVPYRGT